MRSKGVPNDTHPVPDGLNLVPMEVYKSLVDRCARERLDYPIANGSAFHARILISKLFEVAAREVSIVSGELTICNAEGVDVYGYPEVLARAKRFLTDPASRLSIIVESGKVDQEQDNRFLKEVINEPSRNGTVVLTVPPSVALADFSVPHFMVADSSTYRLETQFHARETRDARSITAVANFGDRSTARKLQEYFEELTALVGLSDANVRTFAPTVTF